MKTFAFRLRPGDDLRRGLVDYAQRQELRAPVVVGVVGSLSRAALRMAGRSETEILTSDFEIVSLVGTLAPDGPHLHMAISDGRGTVTGGHVQEGCIVRTTAEVVLGELEEVSFTRPVDPRTGWDELVVTPRRASASD